MPSPFDLIKEGGSRLWDAASTPISDRLGLRIPDDPLFFDEVGNFLLREATNPINIATAAVGGPAAGALRGGGKLGRLAAGLVEPVSAGGFGTRLAGETAVGAGAGAAAQLGAMTGNPLVAAGAGLAGGIASGGGLNKIRPGQVGDQVALPAVKWNNEVRPFTIEDAKWELANGKAVQRQSGVSPIAKLEQSFSGDFNQYGYEARELRKANGARKVADAIPEDEINVLRSMVKELDGGLEGEFFDPLTAKSYPYDSVEGMRAYLSGIQRELTDAWQEGYSGAGVVDPRNVKSQYIAQEVFPDLVSGTSVPNADKAYGSYGQGKFQGESWNQAMRTLMKAEYKVTQDSLHNLGFKDDDTILLFRGLNNLQDVEWAQLALQNPEKFMSGARGSRLMETMAMENVLQTEPGVSPGILGKLAFRGSEKLGPESVFPLSSWTPDIKTATVFGNPVGNKVDYRDAAGNLQSYTHGNRQVILVAEVPVKNIVSIPDTGRGSLSETELVVLGAGKNGVAVLTDVPVGFEFPESSVFSVSGSGGFSAGVKGFGGPGGSNNFERLNNALQTVESDVPRLQDLGSGRWGTNPDLWSDPMIADKAEQLAPSKLTAEMIAQTPTPAGTLDSYAIAELHNAFKKAGVGQTKINNLYLQVNPKIAYSLLKTNPTGFKALVQSLLSE